jgi:hypothetical protein
MMSMRKTSVAILMALPGLAMFVACGGDSGGLGVGAATSEPAPMTVLLDTNATASSTIDSAGGVITATGSDSTVYALTVPPAALLDSESATVTVTPVSSVDGLPSSGGNVTAVQFGPDGLSFGEPATLTLKLPQAYDEKDLLAYTYEGGGARIAFVPIEHYDSDTSIVTILIHHFSGAGVALGDQADLSANPTDPRTERHYRQRIALIERAALQEGKYAYYEPGYLAQISQVYIDWFNGVLADSIQDMSSLTLDPTRELAQRQAMWLADLLETQCKIHGGCGPGAGAPSCFADSGLSPQLDDTREYAAEKFVAQYESGLEAAQNQCSSAADKCDKEPLVEEGLAWVDLAQFGGISFDPCSGIWFDLSLGWDLCQGAAHTLIKDVIYETEPPLLYEGGQTLEGLSAFDMMGEGLAHTEVWSGLSVAWSTDDESVLMIEDVTAQCVSNCTSSVKVTGLEPGVANLVAAVSGDGICGPDPITVVREFAVVPDTAPPSSISGGVLGLVNLSLGHSVQFLAGTNDHISNNRPGYGYLFEETRLDYAEFYLDGELLGVGTCSFDGNTWDARPQRPPDEMCELMHHFPIAFCIETFSKALGVIVVDRAGNRTEYTPLGEVFFESNHQGCP